MYGSNRHRRYLFLGILLLFLDPVYSQAKEEEKLIEPVPQDGFFNNLNHPDWGAVDDILIRKSPPAYQDGVYEPAGQDRPNPFTISEIAHKGQSGLGSARNRTAMLVYFGQQVVEEILDVQRPGCPREFFNIPVPKNHPFNPDNLDNLQMPLQRSRFNQRTGQTAGNPRQQLNEITPFIDGTLFYGPGKAWTDAIREFKRGYLKVRDPSTYNDITKQFPADNDIRLPFANPPPPADHYLKPVNRFFRLGNPRGFENPFLLTFGVIFFRWHNLIAKNLKDKHDDYNDERLFEEARRRVIAHHQKIVMYDWLPRWLEIKNETTFFEIPKYIRDPDEACTGRLCAFNGYDSEIHPGISQEFQTAAMRFGHTLVTPGLWLRGPGNPTNCNWKNHTLGMPNQPHGPSYRPIRLCNAFWNSREPVDSMMDDIIRGMSSTLAEKEDNIVVPDLREHLFGPLEFSRRDLVAINIQRAREHGLTDYNSVRKAFELDPLPWGNVTRHLTEPEELVKLYQNDSSKLDLFVGGLLETTDSGPGPLFKKILLDQFMRIRHGDRFWFENKGNGYNFTDEEIEEIRKVTLRSIILNVTNVREEEIQEDVFIHKPGDVCRQPCQLNSNQTDDKCSVNSESVTVLSESCTSLKHYDYFTGSGAAYILTFLGLGLCVPGTLGIMICMAKYRAKQMQQGRQRRSPHRPNDDPNVFAAVEWVGPNSDERNVKVKLDRSRKKIHVEDMRRKPLRMLDLRSVKQKVHYRLSSDGLQNIIAIRVQGDIDLVIKFLDLEEREKFKKNVDNFLVDLQIEREIHEFTEKSIYDNAQTKEERQKYLDKFFRVICLQAFKRQPGQLQIENMSGDDLNKIIKIKLTRTEFADALGLKPNSIFVRNMFMMVDKNNSGFVEFQEFLDMFVVLASGDAEDKARLIFNMYDVRRQGKLSSKEFARMIHSMLDLSDSSISNTDMQALMNTMYKTAGLPQNADIDFESFAKIFASDEYESTLKKATLGIEALGSDGKQGGQSVMAKKRTTFLESYNMDHESGLQRKNTKIKVKAKSTELPPSPAGQKLYEITRIIENYRLQIFWLSLYILVTIGIFLERAFYYSFEREHAGLRRIAGYGVTVTRGAASVMMFTYASLLVTMSRNTITFLRETFLHRFIPFDSAHAMHKIIARIALLFTVVHCVGHGINLYHISTQASSDLNCIFREYFRATDVLASFQYWAFGTITGLTGIILTLIVIVMYVFATQYARTNLFNAFWVTHSFYILLYIFMVMHGTGRLVQPPLFQNYFYGPLFIFIVDKFISLSRNQVEIDVISADLLPSDVTALKFKRPINFEYKSGQWVRISCAALGKSEYHPFTLTSSPHEDYLSLHIRAVGPWTTNLRKTYDANNVDSENWTPPKVYVDGPFGEGHQDWYKFPVAVLVGGGIGVTPFASILKDIVYKTTQPIRFPCQKVYFLWVTRTQKQFEWLTDIIREVEEKDIKDLVSVHIFITQFQQKFDLRTTMLYICERHFQKIAGKSLFTGLKAVTHFGRPQFQEFLESLHIEHPEAKQIGVFSCGPPPMTLNVDKACAEANKNEGYPTYSHHFENF